MIHLNEALAVLIAPGLHSHARHAAGSGEAVGTLAVHVGDDGLHVLLEQGINVITSAEEMAYPKAQEPELTEELDRIATANGVSVLGSR